MAGWRPFYETVSREALVRLSPAHHPRPYSWAQLFLHPFLILAASLPWSVPALLTLKPGFGRQWDERSRLLLQTFHCWAWPNLVFWSIIPEHAIRNSFPLFPGIAGLGVLGLLSLRSLRSSQVWRWALVGCLACWPIAKIVFVEVIIPRRDVDRHTRATGEVLASLVPVDETLYLFRLKDEGIMFYYGRPVRRLSGPGDLSSSSRPRYCILDESEWRAWGGNAHVTAMRELRDEQGDPIVLVRIAPEFAAELTMPEPIPMHAKSRKQRSSE
jgi:hypothetical protein